MNHIKKLTTSNIKKDKKYIGKKIYNNIFFLKNNLEIPNSFYLDYKTQEKYIKDKKYISKQLKEDLVNLPKKKFYVVRSSINTEDLEEYSFAGQFKTFLNLKNKEEIFKAIKNIYEEIIDNKNEKYVEKFSKKSLKVSILIQEQIQSEYSGVIFTKNPVNYLNETIIEYVKGYGEMLVDKGITPERWKYNWDMWIEKPENPMIDESKLKYIKDKILEIKKEYKSEIDAEWTIYRNKIYFLQLRPITTIKNINIYSNNISKGFLPGLIKPLIWSINIPVVNNAWKKLFENLIKKDSIDINQLAKSIHYRAYFNMGVIGDIFKKLGMPRDLLELLMGIYPKPPKNMFKPSIKTMKYLPKMLVFIIKNVRFNTKANKFYNKYLEKLEAYKNIDFSELTENETIKHIDSLIKDSEKVAYYNIVTPLANSFRNIGLKKYIEKNNYSLEILKEISNQLEIKEIDPSTNLNSLKKYYDKNGDTEKFQEKIDDFLKKFGLLSDSGNDFSLPQWKEDRENIIKMIKNHHKSENKKIQIPEDKKLEKKLKKSKEIHRLKEQISFLYTNLYQIFRPLFLRLAEIYKQQNKLEKKEDIFYLTYTEIKKQEISQQKINKEKQKMQAAKKLNLPGTIIGEDIPNHFVEESNTSLKGTPVSNGYYSGKISIIKGLRDFNKVQKGDIIVIPYSDISWNPIFYKAGAIISESGGMLSHSAIIARELGIPAITSVNNAMNNFKDDQKVFIDATQGLIEKIL
ncbi:MAG: PEP/pyruvate-binding domain-containing protein [Thermotogota bacterium]